jgi:hypothetical protein
MRYTIIFLLLSICYTFGQTSRFERTFRDASGEPLLGVAITLVPDGGSYPADTLRLTEHPTRLGMYYRNAVPDNEYSIYIAGQLYTSNIWVGEKIISDIVDKFNANNELTNDGVAEDAIGTSNLQNSSVTPAKLSAETIALIGNGTGIAPDGLTLELDSTGAVQKIKDEVFNIATSTDLSSVISAVGSSERTIFLPAQTYTNFPDTIPANITLDFQNGAILQPTDTLTINANIVAGNYQIFDVSTGVIKFNQDDLSTPYMNKINACWFGAKGDNSTGNTKPIEDALSSIVLSGSREDNRITAYLPTGYYKLDSMLDIKVYQGLIGESIEQTRLIASDTFTDSVMIRVGYRTDGNEHGHQSILTQLYIDANNKAENVVMVERLEENSVVKNLFLKNGTKRGLWLNSDGVNKVIANNEISDLWITFTDTISTPCIGIEINHISDRFALDNITTVLPDSSKVSTSNSSLTATNGNYGICYTNSVAGANVYINGLHTERADVGVFHDAPDMLYVNNYFGHTTNDCDFLVTTTNDANKQKGLIITNSAGKYVDGDEILLENLLTDAKYIMSDIGKTKIGYYNFQSSINGYGKYYEQSDFLGNVNNIWDKKGYSISTEDDDSKWVDAIHVNNDGELFAGSRNKNSGYFYTSDRLTGNFYTRFKLGYKYEVISNANFDANVNKLSVPDTLSDDVPLEVVSRHNLDGVIFYIFGEDAGYSSISDTLIMDSLMSNGGEWDAMETTNDYLIIDSVIADADCKNVYVRTNDYVRFIYHSDLDETNRDNALFVDKTIASYTDAVSNLGTPNYRFDTTYTSYMYSKFSENNTTRSHIIDNVFAGDDIKASLGQWSNSFWLGANSYYNGSWNKDNASHRPVVLQINPSSADVFRLRGGGTGDTSPSDLFKVNENGLGTFTSDLEVEGNDIDIGDAGGFSGFKFNPSTTEIEFYIDGVLVGSIDATGVYTDEVP